MAKATYTSQLTGIPRSQEIDSSGLGKNYLLTSSSKGALYDKWNFLKVVISYVEIDIYYRIDGFFGVIQIDPGKGNSQEQ